MDRKISTLEQRLTVLCALDALGGVSGVQLLTFMVELRLMDYIELSLALHDLRKAGYLTGTVHPIGMLFQITDNGRGALSMFLKRLPVSRQVVIETNKTKYKSRFLKERTIIGDHRTLANGRVQLELKIGQGDDWLMILLMVLPEGMNAHSLIGVFTKKAEAIYAWLFEELSLGYEPGGEMESARLYEFSFGHYPEDEFSLTLALPGGDLQRHFKEVFEREGARLKETLLSLLKP